MIRMLLVVLALALVQSLLVPSAKAEVAEGFNLVRLLDSDAPAGEREAQLLRLRAMADEGRMHQARCVLGRLGLRKASGGRDLPDGDYGDHMGYLNACVLGGDIDAMLVLAEAELSARRGLEAMIWVQSYIKVATYFGNDVVNSASAYKAGLLQRIERATLGDRPSNEEVLEYVAGLLDAHGERIITGCEAGGCRWLTGMLPDDRGHALEFQGASRIASRSGRDWSRAEDDLVLGTFIAEVDESGRTRRVFALETYPDISTTRRLAGLARSWSYNEVESGAGSRYGVSRLYIRNNALQFVPNAPANSRTRVQTY